MRRQTPYREDLQHISQALPQLQALRGATVLVTGATGLIGTMLTDALLFAVPDVRVIANGRSAERLEARFGDRPGVKMAAADVSSPMNLPHADYILHAASNAHPLAYAADPVGTLRANLLGTLNLLEHARMCGTKRFLTISSGEIYGTAEPREGGFLETDFGAVDPMLPRACYPEGKRAAEALCAAYYKQYGLSATVVRPAYVYGPTITEQSSRADAQFLRNALAGEDIVLKSKGEQVRTYCYVADAICGILTALLVGQPGEAYNLGDPESVASVHEYAAILADCAGVRLRFELPPEAERRGYSTVPRAVQNCDKLMALGWQPKTHLKEGLARTFAILNQSK